MEDHRRCNKCGARSVIFDSPNWVCCQCGTVQDSDHFVSHLDVYTENLGRSVAIGQSNPTVSTNFGGRRIFIRGDYNYKERKEFEARRTIDDIMSSLEFSPSRADDVKYMVEKITEGEWGGGNWFPVLVGACAYVVARQNHLPLTITQVAAVITCDVHELGRMYTRVREFLKLDLPETNIFMILERAIRNSPSFLDIPKEKISVMIMQGRFLLQCSIKWFLTTGRHPLPMITAIVAFVAEINGVKVGVDEISKELSACKSTSRQRLKELQGSLVKVAKKLPWGGDVTSKSLVHHAPFIIQFMQVKSKIKATAMPNVSLPEAQCQKVGTFSIGSRSSHSAKAALDELLDLPSGSSIHRCTKASNTESESDDIGIQEMSLAHATHLNSEKLKLSVECLKNAYARFQERDVSRTLLGDAEGVCGAKRRKKDTVPAPPEKIHAGILNCHLNKRVSSHELLERDVGLDSFPPSFLTSMDVYMRRRRKIEAAKLRINKIMDSKISSQRRSLTEQDNVSDDEEYTDVASCSTSKLYQQAGEKDIDWEDCIIELLLLHLVSEEEIEKGYYRSLLGLYVFSSGHNISNEELGSYLRPKEEVALLSMLKDWE
ncbi:plant-specific TFIIB-related protein PTF2 isoform X2 [Nymphaea colorata]|uniref:plant-specific TFIIB-related protein PTF2 isoform X2 n=1 Tax=Nymphaea colorata TaxID=210225 RepID=UPI00129EDDB5|nr:plant-specific TFIIB-related protein PTF2 isoform X2 [Nymphaea colorata]